MTSRYDSMTFVVLRIIFLKTTGNYWPAVEKVSVLSNNHRKGSSL